MIISDETIHTGIRYIKDHPEIKDVLISGGDPLLLTDARLEWILAEIRAIPTVDIIRLGTRTPCTLPMRITPALCTMLKKYHPLYINTHFNHPREIRPESAQACTMLADAGIPLGCQTVLLKGVNDNTETIQKLMRSLLRIRVKPYYLFQGDLSLGTNHFRTTIETGQKIMQNLLGRISGMGIPTYAVDGPGGTGKIPLTPNYIQALSSTLIFTNYEGHTCFYENGSK
jgi:lysine 2,3-aminomutase